MAAGADLPPGLARHLPPDDAALPRGGRLIRAAEAAGRAQAAEEAAMLARHALAGVVEDPVLRLRGATVLAQAGCPATALAAVAPLLAAIPGDPMLVDRLGMLADTLLRHGAVEEAAAILRRAWRHSRRGAMRRSLLAAGLVALRRSLNDGLDTALLDELCAAATGHPGDIAVEDLAELARLLEETGGDAALRALGLALCGTGDAARLRAVADVPAGLDLNAGGLALRANGRAARAAIAFAGAHAAAPEAAAPRLNAGYAALAAGDEPAAAALLGGLPAADGLKGAAWPQLGELPWPFAPPPAAVQAALEARLPPGSAWPRIRLVTPCFNPGPWLEETILSVAAQGYPALEHVVVDAYSTDGTAGILARHRRLLHGVIREPDDGPAEAIGKGLAGTTADLIGWINADDLLAPGALLRLGAAFAAAPETDIVHGTALPHRARRILGHQRPLAGGPDGFTLDALGDVFGRWGDGAFFLQPEALIARRFWERVGGRLDTSLRAVFDYELWLRAARAAPRLLSVPWPAAMYRIHPAQRTAARAALAEEQVAVRDRALQPAPPPDRAAALRAALRTALAPPARLLLLDPRCGETIAPAALAEARQALAAQGVALDLAPHPPEAGTEASLVLRLLRVHDGLDWLDRLRGAGFAGPVVGWLAEDDRDPYAAAGLARGLDVIVPARAARRPILLQEHGFVLPAMTPPSGLAGAAEEAGALRPQDRLAFDLLAGRLPEPALAALLDGPVPDSPEGRRQAGAALRLAPRLLALLAALRRLAEAA